MIWRRSKRVPESVPNIGWVACNCPRGRPRARRGRRRGDLWRRGEASGSRASALARARWPHPHHATLGERLRTRYAMPVTVASELLYPKRQTTRRRRPYVLYRLLLPSTLYAPHSMNVARLDVGKSEIPVMPNTRKCCTPFTEKLTGR